MSNFDDHTLIAWKQKEFLAEINEIANHGICFALSISWLCLCHKRIPLTNDDSILERITDAFYETTKSQMFLGNVAINAIKFQQEYLHEKEPGNFDSFLHFCKKYIDEIFKFYDVENQVTTTASFNFDYLNMYETILKATAEDDDHEPSAFSMCVIGFYYNNKRINKRGKHAIAMIRAKDQFYVFDPNYGLFYCDSIEKLKGFIMDFVDNYQIQNGVIAQCEAQ